MNVIRKFLFIFAAFAMTALALSGGTALAGDKQYTLVMSPTTGTSPIATMTATFSNKGNSSFNSFTLKVPANYSVAGPITSSRGVVSYSGNPGGTITVVNINLPTGTGQVLTVTMNGVTTAGSCGSGVSGSWTAVLWTCSTLGGSNFSQVGPSTTSTSIAPACYTVTPSSSGNGTISPNTAQTVAAGGTKVFTLAPSTGYNSASVTGTCGGTLVGNSFTTAAVIADCTVIANFALNVYTVTPSAGANGSISPNTPQPVSHGGTKAFTVTPGTGYHIDVMGGTCGGSLAGNTYTTAVVTGDCSVSATFAKNSYLVSTSVGAGGGSFTPASQSVLYQDAAAFTVTPDGTHYIGSVSGCGGSLVGNTYTTGPVTAACTVTATFAPKTLSITSAPSSALVGVPFDVVVGETPGGPTPTMNSDCGATETHTSSPTSTTFTVTAPNLGTCNITFSVTGYTDAQLPNFKVYKGQLGCNDYNSSLGATDFTLDPNLDKAYIIPGGSGWGLRRGPNKDGTCALKVNYTCDLDGVTNIASCSWDKASGQLATFKYVFVWSEVSPGSSGWKDFRPLISWGIANPGPAVGPPTGYNWMPGLACIWDMFPALPTLPTTILPTIPSEAPWTDAGNTSGQYVPGTTAWVCVAQQGSTSTGVPSGPVKLQFWHKVIDEADVLVKGPT